MLYVYKFISGWLLPPGGIIVMLFLLCGYCFKKRSRLRYPLTAVTVTLYLFSILPVAGMLMQGLEKQYVPPALEKIIGKTDAVVVLGGGAVRDVPDISGREALSAVSMNRLITGVRLQKRLDIPIIISGGQVFADSGTEATVAEKVLLELSVPPQQIFTDTEARNTTENAVNVAALCREQQWQKIVLVTSAFHMPRSVLNFADKGLDIVPFPCDYQLSGKMQLSIFRFMPQGFALELSAMALKEYLGLLALKIL